MKRESYHEAVNIYHGIKATENKKTELYGLRSKIIQILEGHIEIPEEEVYAVFNGLEKLSGYLEKDIQKAYKQIDELDNEYNEVVRSALSIAEREGKETNWEAFKNKCLNLLKI